MSQSNNSKSNNALVKLFENIKSDKDLKSNRRDFLKLFGYSFAIGTVLSSCENHVKKAIPYIIQPEHINIGKANYFASSYINGNEYAPVLVKTREGRPIKIEVNDLSNYCQGTNARMQASVLDLYDNSRFKKPANSFKELTWDELDSEIIQKLKRIKSNNGNILLVTPPISSPSTKSLIQEFKNQFGAEWYQYNINSHSAMIEANELCFSKPYIPEYDFSKAEYIVSFDADFLGNWGSPVRAAKLYEENKTKNIGLYSYPTHYQIESRLSLTGASADYRYKAKPSHIKLLLLQLYNEILSLKGKNKFFIRKTPKYILKIASQLFMNKTKSIVVCGHNDLNCQLLCNIINYELKNIGNTIDFSKSQNLNFSDDKNFSQLKELIRTKNFDAIIMYDINPIYDTDASNETIARFKNIPLRISMHEKPNESSELCNYTAPINHYLESWGDVSAISGNISIMQPCIKALRNTRQFEDSLLKWMGQTDSYYTYLKNRWKNIIYPEIKGYSSFFEFWKKLLQKGFIDYVLDEYTNPVKLNKINILDYIDPIINYKFNSNLELQVYFDYKIYNAKLSNNAWLQELPDPISKISWDNFLICSSHYANRKSLNTGDVVKLKKKSDNYYVEVPIYVCQHTANDSFAIAFGYGKSVAGIADKKCGQSASSFINTDGHIDFTCGEIEIIPTGKKYKFAQTQIQNTDIGREPSKTIKYTDYLKDDIHLYHHEVEMEESKIYKDHDYEKHNWGLVVDLNKCIGCGACSVACQVENNIPVVGRTEVARSHEMSWLRIDRYYTKEGMVFQPLMCQHCNNAPCENVCPVAATNHSKEGLNQMAYNRCIGTRYCNNNCPYKVRRFNWFDYTGADSLAYNLHDDLNMTTDLRRMCLNPDVTVRSKGVIEKCSMCIQRIQEGKLKAKLENRKLNENDIQTACQQACPSNAIIFGDLNAKDTEFVKLKDSKRSYLLLKEIRTQASVNYLAKLRNKK
ncbi:MAG: 4Fe-4S dicluster domain-containing protein [Marinifilaceae bacterium]|jgi:molybdopterin-containing oxidoreductase family iron-sulfur binding subunit|nr:4Fe-4S dicluster domain-containing protein [Marinifilaceae bacterium]